ncbi:hypothetical protein SAMN06272759_1441, partial [Novosphingobium sp. B1]
MSDTWVYGTVPAVLEQAKGGAHPGQHEATDV